MSRGISIIWSENYEPVMYWLEERVPTWMCFPLSIVGRISIVTMVILPQLLYLFTNIPVPLTRAFLDRIKTQLNRSVWAGKQPRLAWDVLTLLFKQG